MDDVDFADLIKRARAGDPAATTNLIDRFEGEVRTMVRVRLPRSLRNQFDSMDFVQAVWTSVFTGQGEVTEAFTDPGQFRGFLAGVARNKVYQEHRRQTRTQKYDLGREERLYHRKGDRDVARDVPAPDPSPSETAQARDFLGRLVKGRSEEEATVIDLRRQGLTFAEIARQVGRSERTVRRVIDEARERMEASGWE